MKPLPFRPNRVKDDAEARAQEKPGDLDKRNGFISYHALMTILFIVCFIVLAVITVAALTSPSLPR